MMHRGHLRLHCLYLVERALRCLSNVMLLYTVGPEVKWVVTLNSKVNNMQKVLSG